MSNIFTIYRRELAGYFNTPIAYIFVPIFVAFLAFFFFLFGYTFFLAGDANLRNFFAIMWLALLLFGALVSMRLWSEELRVGTAEILMTLPYTVSQLVVGKFLAAFTILATALLLTLAVPAAVSYAGDPDWGPIICGYVGSFLMGGAFVALGCFASSLTQNQVVALLIALLGGVIFTLALGPETSLYLGGINKTAAGFIEGLSIRSHFESFERGTLVLRDVVFYLSFTAFFLTLNVFRVEARRY